ncbi:MAG TPA: hypothetical protein VEG32_13915 [Clostridia bacterium]|nr:hypothetical protein [Clostridia bacterium]
MTMGFRHKLISTGVLAAVLLLPFLSMALCMPDSAAASMHCPPDCPMMAVMNSGHAASEAGTDDSGSCCTIQSSRPAPVTESQTVVQVFSPEPMTKQVEAVLPVFDRAQVVAETSPPPLIDSQARLCTFLI